MFHIDLKTLVVKGLDILAAIPEPELKEYEEYNSRLFLDLRDELLYHDKVPRQQKHFRAIFNFVIMLYDSDQYYRQRIDWLIGRIKDLPFKEGEPIRPEWWQE